MSEKAEHSAAHIDESNSMDQKYSPEHAPEVWDDSDPRMKKLLKKVDTRILIVLGIVYCISLLDRTNLGFAMVAGMGNTLRLDIGQRYSIIALVFFPTYVIFQIPATVVAKKLGPRWFLSTITVLWGLCMVGFGLVHKWSDLAALRVILGVLEAGLFPGAVYLLSTWYKRYEVAVRNSIFYLIGTAAAGFGGILGYGLSRMNGLQGMEGWRWLFIMEGIITVTVGLAAFILIVDFPEKALNSWKFLTEPEVKMMIARTELDRSDSQTPPFHIGEYLSHAKDFKVWLFALMFGCSTTISYATAFFLPIILQQELGFEVAAAQCLVAPLYVFGALLMWSESVISDRLRWRAPFLIFNASLSIIGLLVLGFAPSKGGKYTGCYFIIAGANANIPFTMTFQHNNIVGQWKRAFASATLVGFGGIGGIVGSMVFQAKDAPKYKFGLYSCILASFISIVTTCVLWVYFKMENKKHRSQGKIIEKTEGFYYTT